VVSVLAVLKAGGAYLALDPSYPSERLAFALSDTRPAVVLTSTSLAGLADQAGIPLFLLDQGGQMLSHLPSHCPELLDGGGRLAYVLYTSGSSGEPKGVLAHHQGVVNRICWMWRQYPFARDERCCIKTSVAFGDSVAEIFAPLLAGVPNLLMPQDALTDHRLFTELLRSGRVSRITLVPSLLRTLLDTQPGLAGYLPALSLVITSGEALPGELAERFFEMLPGRRLLNLYGCSEAAADSSWFEVRAANTPAPVPIGRPLANTQLHVLDPHGQPMPAGLPGELYIGGDGVARAYNERPGLTAERFVPDPFGDDPGARLYRTGDRVRCLPDGTLAFLGRTDTQLKIRGHRIEPGEIESALLRHPEIRQAAVAKRATGTGDERLIAYLVAGDGHQPSAADLRAFLGTTLPGYMLPSGFAFLTAMPLTPSGKLDRRALPALEAVWRDATAYVPPGSALERLIAAVMADTLDLGQVGLHENFFDLGGHSLLASRLIARLQDMLGVKLPLRGFFAVPTVAGCTATAIELSAEGPRLEQRAEAVLEVASLSDDEVARLLGERQSRAGSMSDGPTHD
jgi:amino acid adenylation domain-containing protein